MSESQLIQIQSQIRSRKIIKEVVREVIERSEDESGEKYVVRTLLIDPTSYVFDVVEELILKYCELTNSCTEDVLPLDTVVAVSTSNCREWHDELLETLTILAVAKHAPYTVYYVYDGGIEDLCIDSTCWHHLEIPKVLEDLIDEIYGDLAAPCR